jgi:hypothetical protein
MIAADRRQEMYRGVFVNRLGALKRKKPIDALTGHFVSPIPADR